MHYQTLILDITHINGMTNASARYTTFSSSALAPSADNNLAVHPSTSLLTHKPEKTSSQPIKKVKKGTEAKKPHVPTRRWSRTHLNQIMREHRPKNLPKSIKLTDHINVQDVPIQKLTPAYCVVGGDNDGRTIQFGAGTRVEVQFDANGNPSVPVYGGVPHRIERREFSKATPFRLVLRDRQGNIKVDMRWHSCIVVGGSTDV